MRGWGWEGKCLTEGGRHSSAAVRVDGTHRENDDDDECGDGGCAGGLLFYRFLLPLMTSQYGSRAPSLSSVLFGTVGGSKGKKRERRKGNCAIGRKWGQKRVGNGTDWKEDEDEEGRKKGI
jgi:hypothetical protein